MRTAFAARSRRRSALDFLLLFGLALLLFSTPSAQADSVGDAAETRSLHALFDARWEELMRTYPEWATYSGDHRYGERLHDASAAAQVAGFDAHRRALAQARQIRRDALSATDRMSLDLFLFNEQAELDLEPFVGFRSMALGARGGLHSDFAGLMQAVPMDSAAQARQLLARFAAFPTRMDQELAQLRRGLALQWVPPRTVLERVLAQIDEQLATPLEKGPFFEPFTRLGADLPAAEQGTLRDQARQRIEQDVLPALRRLRDFVAGEYLPSALASGALMHYPQGPEVYALLIRQHTTSCRRSCRPRRRARE